MMKSNQIVIALVQLITLFAGSACTSDQSEGVIRNTVRIVVETDHQNEENASLPNPEKNILPGSFVTKSYYDAEHFLLKVEKWSPEGKLEWKEEFVYDEAGNNIERLNYHRDSLTIRTVQRFNAANRLIRAEEYGSNEKLLRKMSVAYDRNRNGLATTFTNIEDVFIKSIESLYDSSNRLIENRYFTQPPGEQPDKILLPGLNSWLKKDTYLYDAKNNLIQTMRVDSNLLMNSNTSMGYDSLSNLTTLIIQSTDRSRAQQYRYEYQYDQNGEWTRRKTFLNNHLMAVTKKQISSLTPGVKANQ